MFAREVIMNLKTCVKATVLTIGLAGIVTAGIVNAEDITNPTTENPMATEATINDTNTNQNSILPGDSHTTSSVKSEKRIDYKGATSAFLTAYPNANITAVSYTMKYMPMYEVEGFVDGQKISVNITESGEIIKRKVKTIQDGDSLEHMAKEGWKQLKSFVQGKGFLTAEERLMSKSFDVNNVITPDQAKSAVEKALGSEFKVASWELEKDKDLLVYDLDMVDNTGKKVEVTVNATNGEIIRTDMQRHKY